MALFSCAYKTTPTVKEQDIAKNMLRFYGQIVLVYLRLQSYSYCKGTKHCLKNASLL